MILITQVIGAGSTSDTYKEGKFKSCHTNFIKFMICHPDPYVIDSYGFYMSLRYIWYISNFTKLEWHGSNKPNQSNHLIGNWKWCPAWWLGLGGREQPKDLFWGASSSCSFSQNLQLLQIVQIVTQILRICSCRILESK